MDWDPPGENELRSWRISAWARQRGLQYLTMGTHRVDLVRRQRFTQGGSGTSYSVANTKAGRAVEAASAGTLSLQATPRNIFGNGDVTVVLVGAPVANASSVQLLLYQVNGSSGVWLSTNGDESFNATSGRLSLNFLQAGVDRSAIYATSQFDGGLHAWVIRKKPSAHRIWRDGEQQTTTTVSGLAGAPTSASDTLNILGITTDGSYAAIDPVAMMAVFRGRGLSDSDCIRLSTIGREQVGLLLEPPRRVMWPVSATANAYTLTITQGAYTLTGNSATAAAARRLAITQGSYALTGSSAGLAAARRLTITQGAYALTGNNLALAAARQLSISQGAYSLTGNNAGLAVGRRLGITSGTYALTGQAVQLVAARRLSISQATYTLTGADVTLTKAAAGGLQVTQGSYALTGNSAQLAGSRRLTVTQGSYALAGFDVALAVARARLQVTQGTYVLTGQDLAFARALRLAITAGVYTLTGQALTLLAPSAGVVIRAALTESRRLRTPRAGGRPAQASTGRRRN